VDKLTDEDFVNELLWEAERAQVVDTDLELVRVGDEEEDNVALNDEVDKRDKDLVAELVEVVESVLDIVEDIEVDEVTVGVFEGE
jgi:hypothetical protein